MANKLVQLVLFEIDSELYGFDIQAVHEVIRFDRLTPSPGSIKIIEGVIDLRGDIIPVINLKKCFRKKSRSLKIGAKILITEVQKHIFGLIVDNVEEVASFPLSEFKPPSPGINHREKKFTIGIIQNKKRLLFYLDVEQILLSQQLFDLNDS